MNFLYTRKQVRSKDIISCGFVIYNKINIFHNDVHLRDRTHTRIHAHAHTHTHTRTHMRAHTQGRRNVFQSEGAQIV